MNEGVSGLDHHFAKFLSGRSGLEGVAEEQFYAVVSRLSAALEGGHSCLRLVPEEVLLFRGNPLVSVDGEGHMSPLILAGSNLYLHRYYTYETRLAKQILTLAGQSSGVVSPPLAEDVEAEVDYQKEAARVALQNALTIISGGPGTGKTTTVVKILALLVESCSESLKIGLAAPTGKAAMRLSDSIGTSLANHDQIGLHEDIVQSIPTVACTLHRLLGVRRNSPQFIHNNDNPLDFDVVVVDEASMVDLAMMSKLVDSLKPGAKLILLGDKDQLASVESGAVLVDLINSLPENSIELQKSYRFDANIKQLAVSINNAELKTTWDLLNDGQAHNVSLLASDELGYIGGRYSEFMELVHQRLRSSTVCQDDIQKIFQSFQSFQVLCCTHHGERGVRGINQRVERSLAAKGFECKSETWYPGRPVLITRNDYGLDLYNGDIGIYLPGMGQQGGKVWFERPDGSVKGYSPNRLPQCETVFAMTIHKSQGSEFSEVVVVLPEADSRILSRELIYTGVTRAKSVVRLVSDKAVLGFALERNIRRHSGLQDFLR